LERFGDRWRKRALRASRRFFRFRVYATRRRIASVSRKFFAETGIENAPKRKRTANAKPGPLGVGWGALEPTRQNFRLFSFFGGQVGRLASYVDLTFEKKTIMKG
jgi:hypothetical protein